MNLENRRIAESLKPTFENVSREFIVYSMNELLFSDEIPNIYFDFKENEAIKFIENVMNDFACNSDFFKKESKKIIKNIKNKEYKDNNQFNNYYMKIYA